MFILLIGGLNKTYAQAPIQSPDIKCVSVDSSGGVALTWKIPPKLDNSFINYQILTATTGNGPYATGPAIVTSSQTSSYLSAPSANSGSTYYIIYTDTTGGSSALLDTMRSMYLTVTNTGAGTAQLVWNSIHNPMLSTSTDVYNIFREYPKYVWTQVGTVKSTAPVIVYYDTIYLCNPVTLTYRVEITDTSVGCISTSNRDSATGLFEQFAPPTVFIDSLSVTPGNTIDLTWSKSIHNNVKGYIIYEYYVVNHVGKWVPIDTVWGINTTSLINFTKGPFPSDSAIGNPSDSGLSFEVAALDSCGKAGVISPQQNTMLLTDKPNSCAHNTTLSWNPYVNLIGSVGGYKVYVSINNRAGPYTLLGTTNATTTTFIDSNLNTPENRYYYVRVFDSAHHDTTASSNILLYNVHTAKQPIHNYLGSASVVFNSSDVNLFFYMDTLSGAGSYEYQRSPDSTGETFTTFATVTAPHHVSDSLFYLDNSVDPRKQSYRYRIVTVDSCDNPMDTTNIGQTVHLVAVGLPSGDNILQWNDYHTWQSGPLYYLIYRSVDGFIWTEIHQTNYDPADNGYYSYDDNVHTITVGQGTFYYYVKAVEKPSGIYPFVDTSYSNIAEAYQDPIVWIPNAFDPKGINHIFKPVGVFIDVTGYDLVILNRWGIKVFESTDPNIGWDGTHTGSKPVEEDVYVYLLTYTSSRGQYFQRKGTVMLLK